MVTALVFALLTPWVWGFSNILDKYVIVHKVKNPLSFAVVAAVVNIVIGLVLAVFLDWSGVSFMDYLYPVIAGFLLGLQFYFYFLILQKEDVSHFYKLFGRGAKKIGLKIPKSQYPQIEVGEEPSYDPLENKITLPEEYLYAGRLIGEYLGHALRELSNRQRTRNSQKIRYSTALLARLGFKPNLPQSNSEKRDIEVDEFFGYLGRFLLKDTAMPRDNLNFEQTLPYRMKEQHQKAYQYARKLRPEEVDYKAIFQMPNKEVREKFFKKQQPLEQLVQLILPISAVLTLILIAKNITGYAIQNNSQQTSPFQILLIIFLLILLYKNLNLYKNTNH